MRVPTRIALAVLLLGVGGSVAQPRMPTLDPTFGTATLAAGFENDPFTTNLVAGGAIDAAALGSQCAGYISAAPDYRLTYTGTGAPLIISVVATDDTTLGRRRPGRRLVLQ